MVCWRGICCLKWAGWRGSRDCVYVRVKPIIPDLTGFIMTGVDRTSMNGVILDQSRLCGNLLGLWLNVVSRVEGCGEELAV